MAGELSPPDPDLEAARSPPRSASPLLPLPSVSMWSSSFRLALRSLRRNRGFALLNVGGLALGLACVLLIALYVQDERAVDAFHQRADRIARVDIGLRAPNGVARSRGQHAGHPGRRPLSERDARGRSRPSASRPPTPSCASTASRSRPSGSTSPTLRSSTCSSYHVCPGRTPATALGAPGRVVLTAPHAARLCSAARRALGRDRRAGQTGC